MPASNIGKVHVMASNPLTSLDEEVFRHATALGFQLPMHCIHVHMANGWFSSRLVSQLKCSVAFNAEQVTKK